MNFQFDFDNEAWKKNSEKFRKQSEKIRKEWDADRKKMEADRTRRLKEMDAMRDQALAGNRQRLHAMRDSSMVRQRQQMLAMRDSSMARQRQRIDEQREYVRHQAENARHEADKAYRNAEAAREKANTTSQKYREMINKMAADKLIDNQHSFTIEKNTEGLFINGVKQSDSVADKYNSYLKNKRTYIRQAEPGNLNINIED